MATTIREWLDAWDAYSDKSKEDDDIKEPATRFNNIYLGAPQVKKSLLETETSHQSHPAFQGFRRQLSDYLSNYIQVLGQDLPSGRWLNLQSDYTVIFFYLSYFLY